MSTNKLLSLLILLTLGIMSCEDDDGTTIPSDSFDRRAMLVNWADNIIVPSYIATATQTENLKTAVDSFLNEQTPLSLLAVREAWLDAYLSWQTASMFEIGKAEELMLRDFVNIYPVDASGIIENIGSGSYNLELPSQRDRQGFAALDFMLFGLGTTDQEVLNNYTGEQGADYLDYLSTLTIRIDELVDATLASWVSGYRDEFVGNDGSSANASVDKLVNDFMFYYEKALRAGKVGIPAGVFSGGPLPTHVEGLHSGQGKLLLSRALGATLDFFEGKHLNSSTDGIGLADYLKELEATKDGTPLEELIINQFAAGKTALGSLTDNLSEQVETNNILMLQMYDELQRNVVLMKVDMFQSLSINVDYVDADGD